MKKHFPLLGMALAACLLPGCSDDPKGEEPTPTPGTGDYVYMVAYSSGDDVGYLKQVNDISTGALDGLTGGDNLQEVNGNQDYTSIGDKYLYNINYGSQGSSGISTISTSWGLNSEGLVVQRNEFDLQGDVKARGVVGKYFVAATNAAENDLAYERIKIVDSESQAVVTNHGKINTDASNSAWKSQVAEHVTFSDIAEFGDYVLVGFTTKKEATGKKTTTDLAMNTYVGVFKFDAADAANEYLKFDRLLVRDGSGENPSGQVKGNSRSRTETGIEPTDDGNVYVFAQGLTSNTDGTQAPSTVLRLSLDGGVPSGFDSSYYVDLNDLSNGHYLWRSYYLGGTKFCLQFFSEPNSVGTDAIHGKFAIFDVSTKNFKWVEGCPEDITDIALFYLIEKEKGSVTFGIETASQKPALYTVSSDGTMKRGLEVNAEHIKGVARFKK